MSSTEDETLNLLLLPSDIIRNIIRVGQESMECMRLISPRWNYLVMDRHKIGKLRARPVIKLFLFTFSPGKVTMAIRITKGYENYFGVDKWTFLPYSNNMESDYSLTFNWVHLFNEKSKELTVRIGRLFNRCSRIKRLAFEIDYSKKGAEMDIIGSMIGHVIIDEFIVTGIPRKYNHWQNIMQFLQNNVVRYLAFYVFPDNYVENSIQFISEAAQHVSAIVFDWRCSSYGIDYVNEKVIRLNRSGLLKASSHIVIPAGTMSCHRMWVSKSV